jgi:Ser/Thr protein kinase RdoA (MazF antagonist)
VNYAPSSTDAQIPDAVISHSVLHPDFIATQVASRYDLQGEVSCFLLYRGMNDVYLLQDKTTKYALRVWRKTWRDVANVGYELSFLAFLKERGFPASFAVPQKDGALWFKVNTPEGVRSLALYEWAPGSKFGECLSEDTAHRIGAHFAGMHLLGLEWAGPEHRFSSSKVKEFTVWLPALLEFVYDRPDDVRDYAIIAERLSAKLDQLAAEGVPMGVCHRDFHPSNVHVDESGRITLLDFDAAGEDFLMQDVQNYVWGNLFYNFSPAYGEAFETGYQTVRPFTPAEVENTELFLMAKAFRLVSGMANASSAVGRGTLRFRGLDWLGDYTKTRARRTGML